MLEPQDKLQIIAGIDIAFSYPFHSFYPYCLAFLESYIQEDQIVFGL